MGAANVDLAGGQKHIDANVDQQAAFDFSCHVAGDDIPFVDGLHDLHPLFDFLRFALAQHNHAAIVVAALGSLPHLPPARESLAHGGLLFILLPLIAGDGAFAFVADVDEHELVIDADDFSFDDLIDIDILAYRASWHHPRRFRRWMRSSLLRIRRIHELDYG